MTKPTSLHQSLYHSVFMLHKFKQECGHEQMIKFMLSFRFIINTNSTVNLWVRVFVFL